MAAVVTPDRLPQHDHAQNAALLNVVFTPASTCVDIPQILYGWFVEEMSDVFAPMVAKNNSTQERTVYN